MNQQVKPPLGLVPRFIRDQDREVEIKEAISRYNAVGKDVPVEWTAELEEIAQRQLSHCCASGGVAEEEPLSPEEERASGERYTLSVSPERLHRNLEKRRKEGERNGSV